jgi:hypothetical protein
LAVRVANLVAVVEADVDAGIFASWLIEWKVTERALARSGGAVSVTFAHDGLYLAEAEAARHQFRNREASSDYFHFTRALESSSHIPHRSGASLAVPGQLG